MTLFIIIIDVRTSKMKKLVLLVLSVLCFGQMALATGKLQFSPSYYMKSKQVGYMGGLVIAEPVFLNLHYIQWTGMGSHPWSDNPTITWFGSRHDLETYWGPLAVAVGVGVNYGDENFDNYAKGADYNAHAKLTFTLW